MIISITMNPSVDISYPMEEFTLDTVNRVKNVTKTAGGKGLNVARVLHQTKAEVLASGMIGGHLGEFIETELEKEGIQHHFFAINGQSRNCIAILHEKKQTEILEQGPVITEEEAEHFLKFFEQLIEQADLLTFSGSLPAGLSDDYYAKLIHLCNKKNKDVILDCSGKALQEVLSKKDKPLLIKPNKEELAALIGKPVQISVGELKNILSSSLFDDIEWVVVSMGKNGAFAKHRNTFYQVTIPKIGVINPVGSGDATIAGFAQSLANYQSDETILKHGNALGMLNAQEKITGRVNMQNYHNLVDQIKVTQV
ncbi:tagatose-6-phosphate kinase [Tetragenococcus osmophilus]|uniref:Tagatose-6-phosphate kinase n=1 Tax=Tetragenococcus osmophilus TaxID=526944 RepID=A0ABM7A8H6_9ENTE|nr:tagatose-6-phosphate kinase [Tetragenococcus osmophilus]AYW47741.1 tagatose-6-phosphate kinase [Tetragenococcus osmophilus]